MNPCNLTELILIEMHVAMDDKLLKSEKRRINERCNDAACTQQIEGSAQDATGFHR